MRSKQLAQFLPIKQAKTFWERLTFSRLTTAYFLFSVVHCIIQSSLQIRAFTINVDAAKFLSSISYQAGAVNNSVPVLSNDDLRLCDQVPVNYQDINQCTVIWNGTAAKNWISANDASSYSAVSPASSLPTSAVDAQAVPLDSTSTIVPSTTTITVLPSATADGVNNIANLDALQNLRRRDLEILVFDQDGTTKVNITGEGYSNTPATLSSSCLWSLNWPVSVLDNTKREDVVFIAFQFWVLGMSIVAILNESIPHIFASLLTHVMATAWSGFQIVNTSLFRSNFNRVITGGACNGISLLPNYWSARADAEYPMLALNILSLFISGFLTWKLVKLFGWQTFKRVGASLSMNRIYKLALVLSIVLQLGFFFIGATVSLWLDSLINGIGAELASYVTLYKASSIATLVLLVPWMAMGWIAVRQEMRLPMFLFLVLSLLYLGGWSVMFLADTFRWSFLTWRFFTVMATASVALTLLAFTLGVVCRYNFGKGLPRYLNAEEPLPGDDFAPVYASSDMEKVDFPSNEKPIPTFSATFGSGPDVPPPSQMFAPRGPRMGPRFYNLSAEPFESPVPSYSSLVTAPMSAMTRSSSHESPSLIRTDSVRSSDKSINSLGSYYSYSSPTERSEAYHSKRWAIE